MSRQPSKYRCMDCGHVVMEGRGGDAMYRHYLRSPKSSPHIGWTRLSGDPRIHLPRKPYRKPWYERTA